MNDNDRIAPKDLHKYEPVTRHLGDKLAGVTFYAERGQPILKVIDSLAEVKRYKIRDFYKPELIEQALAEVLKSRGLETVAHKDLRQAVKRKSGLIPKNDRYAKMVASLQANTEAVAEYFTSYLDSYLIEGLTPTLKTEQEGGKSTDELLNGTEIKKLIPLTDGVYTSKNGSKTKQQGYTVPDQKALEQFIKGELATEYKQRKIGMISETVLQQGSTDLESYGDKIKAIANLGKASGINLGEYPDQDKGTITINTAFITLESLLRNTLYQMVKITKAKPEGVDTGAGRKVVNIKDADKHSFIGRPTNTSFIDMVAGAVEGRDMAKLKETYLDPESRKDDGGFLAHIANPQEALPFVFDDNDRPTLVKFMANSVAMAGDAIDALQAYRRDNPDYTGYVKITDIAKYIDQYASDMARGKGLRPEYRQRILNGFTIAGLMGTDYIISNDRKRKTTKVRRVYVVDRITEYERNSHGTVVAIKNPDFTDDYKANLASGLNLGVITDGIRNLETTEAKVLARYIADRQVAKLKETVTGKPIAYRASTLCKMASITDQHVTNRYRTLAKMLNDLEARQTIVGKWVTKAGGKAITGYNTDSQTIYITATQKAIDGYATREATKVAREAGKLEQKARVKALKTYAKGYTDLGVLAKEMGITRPDLELLLGGKRPITDSVLRLIDLDIAK